MGRTVQYKYTENEIAIAIVDEADMRQVFARRYYRVDINGNEETRKCAGFVGRFNKVCSFH